MDVAERVEIGPRLLTDKMRELELFYGIPIRDLVIARLRTHRSYRKAARSLGVSHTTLQTYWIPRLAIPVVDTRKRRSS